MGICEGCVLYGRCSGCGDMDGGASDYWEEQNDAADYAQQEADAYDEE